jgi:hypothetical protein
LKPLTVEHQWTYVVHNSQQLHGQQLSDESKYDQVDDKTTPPPPPNLLNLIILNRWILLSSCGSQHSYRDFRFFFFGGGGGWCDYFDRKGKEMLQLPFSRMVGKPSSAGTTVKGTKT